MIVRRMLDILARWLIVCIFCAALTCGAKAVDLGVAGVPQDMGRSKDYDSIFAALKAAGVSVYFPTSQYQEQPSAKSLGTESDFLVPCTPESPAFAALRRHNMRLLVAGELLYARGQSLPALQDDPLSGIIACAGRENIYGILSYDEPVSSGATTDDVAKLFSRVKEIDSTLPVVMVHAPIVLDKPELATLADQSAYLEQVRIYSKFADIVGFDVYPVIREIAQVGTPNSESQMVDHTTAIKDYIRWLREWVPGRKYMMVLQGFSYADQYEPSFLRTVAPREMIDKVRPPNQNETMEMARLSVEGGANLLVWWGVSFQKDGGSQIWQDILKTSRTLSGAQ